MRVLSAYEKRDKNRYVPELNLLSAKKHVKFNFG